jgi:hypothetical protein
MTRVTLYAHPFAPAAPQVFEVNSLAQWLLGHYGATPTVKVQVYVGEPSAETEVTNDVAALVRGDAPTYTVLQSPGGFDPFTWFIIALVVTVAVVVLMPKPEMPGNINRTQSSPNNALGSRENKVRMLERVEDIYGIVKSIPSLMMPTYNKYIGHEKFEYGYYCISRGYCDVADLKDGDTLISDISGASAAVYHPFTSPNSGTPVLQVGSAIIDDVITAARSIEVDGITLKALNQVQLPASGSYTFSASGLITQAAKNPNFNSVANTSDSITVTMSNYAPSSVHPVSVVGATRVYSDFEGQSFDYVKLGDTVIFSGFANAANNGSFLVTGRTYGSTFLDTYTPGTITVATGSQVDEVGASVTITIAPYNYSGTYTATAVGDGTVTLSGTSWPRQIDLLTCSVQISGGAEYSDWITLPDTDRTQVWCNVTAPNGMYKDSGGKSVATVAFDIEIEQLDATTLLPLGVPVVETVTGSLSGSVTEVRADTIEHTTAWTGPARVRMRRTTAYDYAFSGTVMDEIKWADLYSITPVSVTHFGNKTTVHTITQATARATAVKTRQLNCIASRLLPTYNGSTFSATLDATGLKTSGTLYTTSKLVDIIAAVSVDPKIGARTLADDVDMAQIWEVQQELDAWSADCGQFNYTFDSDNTSYEETLILIANAGFCIAYRQNGKIRLAFDKEQTASSALFTHRNKKPKSETITRSFASDSDYDGVQFTYMDPDTEMSETISLPLDASATKYKKFEIAGIRSYTQAWYRASRECAKLRGQRITLETTTTLDARALLPNARIDVVDNTRFKSYDGEVVGQSGLEITLSQDVAFVPATAHSIVLMKRDGSLQSIACTAGSAANKVILATTPAEAIVTTYGSAGIRTIYSFAADSARAAQAYLVQELDISDSQYCQIRAINYSADYYASDTAAVPDKATVIN